MHVSLTFLNTENYLKLKDSKLLARITDSKLLSDATVYYLAPKLKTLLSDDIFTVSFKIKEYNKIYSKIKNINALLSYAHDSLWKQLNASLRAREEPPPEKTVIDQFCPQDKYYEYLAKIGVKGEEITNFETKAELNHLSCAISSIISRFNFLEEISELSRKLHYNLPLGASHLVIDAFRELRLRKETLKAEELCKTHFKTYEKALAV
ncbi:ribonuclease HIII [Mycoplasma wenyonii str. Massachusetts]|uniref:Ribonuclease n=2 Tax=Mycoplasma wenyonii TaxID=65123 RepID=I6YAE3_MYCWM|nr:ribonuclease HIII [Mycoplasma wenyonii str. Massachusetts]